MRRFTRMPGAEVRKTPVRIPRAGVLFLLIVFSACIGTRRTAPVKPTVYDLAPRTTRADIVRESTIALYSFSFTIEYASIHDNYAALRTDWRLLQTVLPGEEGDVEMRIRDRAILHLSPRSYQRGSAALVASRIEFEVQTRIGDEEKWIRIEPDPALVEEYDKIVDTIRTRLSHAGYKFN